jgi:hypothetical protein
MPPCPDGPLSTGTIGDAIELVEWRIRPFRKSSSICPCISGFKISGIRYSLRRFGLKLDDTIIRCSMYGQNQVYR